MDPRDGGPHWQLARRKPHPTTSSTARKNAENHPQLSALTHFLPPLSGKPEVGGHPEQLKPS
jgi:hypothetical protein